MELIKDFDELMCDNIPTLLEKAIVKPSGLELFLHPFLWLNYDFDLLK